MYKFIYSLDDNKTYIEKYMIADSIFKWIKGDNKLDLNNFLLSIKSRNKELKIYD